MKTQIILSSFDAAAFPVLPVVIPGPPERAAESSEPILIDWLAGLPRRCRPARRLPSSSSDIKLGVGRTLYRTNHNFAQ
jgi:hypothetical protein